jgi:protein-tyrosine-phosphatase
MPGLNPPSVLFVCTANICRSPMAMALMRARLERLEEDWKDWLVESAGTWTVGGVPASSMSQKSMARRGLSLMGHLSRPVTEALLQKFNLILTMESGHKEALCVEFPSIAPRIFLLSEMAGEEAPIDDPYGGNIQDFEQAIRDIDNYLEVGWSKIIMLARGGKAL